MILRATMSRPLRAHSPATPTQRGLAPRSRRLIRNALALLVACGDNLPSMPTCAEQVVVALPSMSRIDCQAAFDVQAARPLDSALPGALTIKTMLDRSNRALYFLDTNAYPLHQTFAIDQLQWPPGTSFLENYRSPDRRYLLGAVTYYVGPAAWTMELAPYDNADVEMIQTSFAALAAATFFGADLRFHPTSAEQEAKAATSGLPTVTTDELYAGIDYQPLNLATTYAQVRSLLVTDLETTYVSPRELVVLDSVPNDIAVVAGVVTEEFQTPLSHVNVLSQQRGTPNMGLRGARQVFAPYSGKWVRLDVRAFDWSVTEVTASEAEAWWQEHKPTPIEISEPDTSWSDFRSVDDVSLADLPAVGGKAAQYGELRNIMLSRTGAPMPVRAGFVIPVVHYETFLHANGFDTRIAAMLADPDFQNDGNLRRERLAVLRADMEAAPIDPVFLADLEATITTRFGAARMKFRSSTNAEDLNGFNGAGLYESVAGEVGSTTKPVATAVKRVWASLWNVRAYEEREYRSIPHARVYMGVLVVPSYTDETANGVAISANIFDPIGEDGFYINAQVGETSVVQPPSSGVVADQLLYYYYADGQPATYYAHSNLSLPGQEVLLRGELFLLGECLDAIRTHFGQFYEPPPGYARLPMDVEWKRDPDGSIWIKQARPYPGRGTSF